MKAETKKNLNKAMKYGGILAVLLLMVGVGYIGAGLYNPQKCDVPIAPGGGGGMLSAECQNPSGEWFSCAGVKTNSIGQVFSILTTGGYSYENIVAIRFKYNVSNPSTSPWALDVTPAYTGDADFAAAGDKTMATIQPGASKAWTYNSVNIATKRGTFNVCAKSNWVANGHPAYTKTDDASVCIVIVIGDDPALGLTTPSLTVNG